MPNLVKQLRLERQLTQKSVAETIGVTTRTIISIERGQYKPSILLAYKLAQFFNTTIETLFCLSNYQEDEQ
ncbi:helix-turn-helix transcriptional regulator [Levilactobacillus bambusae]|uniref:Transcriptional regulator n=1 Tax=Levilactobacillus bambusae TaxID=2024736 RepID=A0A2V1N0Z4_9LACO|nr:helix-turn-helix transcriptional regulator [Levilactobacillus bambusae]PWG00418.1 transcriptional regulator [Levilactobacillus bambusae]